MALATLGGAGVALQSRINSTLAERLHDGIAAAAVSFGSGLVLVGAVALGAPAGRRSLTALRAALRAGRLRLWECVGGVSGAYFVVTQGLTVAALGLASYTVALVAGQVASGLVVDRVGLGPGGRHAVSATRTAGAAIALLAVVVAVADRLRSPAALGLAALPALAGVFIAWQQAVNGRVRAAAGVVPSTLVNFLVGTLALVAALVVSVLVRGRPGALPAEPWLYTGGALGIVFIAVAAVVVPMTGVLVLGLAMIAGQVAGAVLIDLVAPVAGATLSTGEVAGAALALVAVAVAARRPPAGRQATADPVITDQAASGKGAAPAGG